MIEFDVNSNLQKTLHFMETNVGPRKFWIHNKIGGIGWTVNINHGKIRVSIEDNATATWILLKFNQNT